MGMKYFIKYLMRMLQINMTNIIINSATTQ